MSPRRTLIMHASKAFLVVQGLTVGLLINTLLFLFTGVILGWGVDAPEWMCASKTRSSLESWRLLRSRAWCYPRPMTGEKMLSSETVSDT